jgi:NADH dehydrogenase
MKALFIGGSGYIGRNLMVRMNHEETSYYSRSKIEGEGYEKFNWIEGDVSEKEKLVPLLKDYEIIYYLSNSYSDDEKEAFKVNVQGIKDVAAEVKRIDKNQRLIYFSSVNVHYGTNEYFRTKRTGEDNAALTKNFLIVRMSFVFGGEGDNFLKLLKSLFDRGIEKFPKGGRLCPTHIDDLAMTISKSDKVIGAIYTNSNSVLSTIDVMNLYAKKFGKNEIKETGGILSRNYGEKLIEERKIDRITFDRLMTDYYRETSSVIRFVKEPKKFEDFLQDLPKA